MPFFLVIIAGNQNLGGTIFTEIGQLTRLEDLEIKQTGISGQLPPQIGMLASLEVFDACTLRPLCILYFVFRGSLKSF